MKVDSSIIEILENSEILEDGIKLSGQMDRKVYTDVDKVIVAMGGKWNRKLDYHYFEYYDPQEELDKIIETGEIIGEKQKFQFFPTPYYLIAEMNKEFSLMICDGVRILEPSAGSGNILNWLKKHNKSLKMHIDCCEVNKRLRSKLVSDGWNIVGDDFLQFCPEEPYDLVIANPPFSGGQDIDHVRKMFDCIYMGGMVVSVMSSGVMNRSDKKTAEFRDFVYGECCGEFIPVKSGMFKSAGTNVSTCIAVLNKVGC